MIISGNLHAGCEIRILPTICDGKLIWYNTILTVFVENRIIRLDYCKIPEKCRFELIQSLKGRYSIRYEFHCYWEGKHQKIIVGRTLFLKIKEQLYSDPSVMSFNEKILSIDTEWVNTHIHAASIPLKNYEKSYIKRGEKLFNLNETDYIEMIKNKQPEPSKLHTINDLAKFGIEGFDKILMNLRDNKICQIINTE